MNLILGNLVSALSSAQVSSLPMPSDNDWNPAIQPNPSRKGQEHVPFLGNFNRGRGATLNVTVTTTAAGKVGEAPATSSLGLVVEKTFKITASPLDEEGFYVYELTDDDGHVMAAGPGNRLSDALLGFAIKVESGDSDDPGPVGE